MEYHITWKIEVDAHSFEDAVLVALDIQRDPNSIATHFNVQNKAGVVKEMSVSNQPPKDKENSKPKQAKGTPE